MSDRAISLAQIGITLIFIVGYFGVLFCFLTGLVKVPADYREMFSALLGVITGSLGTVVAFWFSRSRQAS